jgi:AcrR family transcriptional regulator
MRHVKEDAAREERILDAAVALMLRQGYDKTTMSDIAEEAGVGRGILYQRFQSKDDLFEALLSREVLSYGQAWADYMERDTRGGTIGGLYRAVLFAVNSRPFMGALMRRDRHVLGAYLRKPDNLLASMQSSSAWLETLRAMQATGVVRQELDPSVIACLMEMLSFGLVNVDTFTSPGDVPPFDALIEAMAAMMDRFLTPEDGGNPEAGTALILELAARARAQFEQASALRRRNESKERKERPER